MSLLRVFRPLFSVARADNSRPFPELETFRPAFRDGAYVFAVPWFAWKASLAVARVVGGMRGDGFLEKMLLTGLTDSGFRFVDAAGPFLMFLSACVVVPMLSRTLSGCARFRGVRAEFSDGSGAFARGTTEVDCGDIVTATIRRNLWQTLVFTGDVEFGTPGGVIRFRGASFPKRLVACAMRRKEASLEAERKRAESRASRAS